MLEKELWHRIPSSPAGDTLLLLGSAVPAYALQAGAH